MVGLLGAIPKRKSSVTFAAGSLQDVRDNPVLLSYVKLNVCPKEVKRSSGMYVKETPFTT